ncbi:MAG TPA: response regulator [Rhodocyclaceae bacterium]
MANSGPPANAADVARLLSELQVQHVELEQQQTELTQQNEALRQAREEAAAARDHYAGLYESAPIGYLTLAADGRISAVNQAAARLLQLPREAIVGQPLAQFVAPEALQAFQGFLARMVFPEGTEACTVRLLRARDGPHPVVRMEGRLDAAGQEFLVALLDVTDGMRAEAALAAARDAAEEANRAKSSFLANMSHEMRTPLHIVVGLGHLLRRALADTAQQQRIDQLCANSEHLLELINDVLDLSRIEAGRLVLDRRPFRLADVAARLLGVVALPARTKGIELSVEVDEPLRQANLLGDPLRLAQILINLGSNAVKFTERGSIRVTVDCLGETIDGLQLRFAVQDSGIGIAPADQEHLFEVFRQADNSPTRAHGGSGLGLAISQRLVGMMGGRIEVESQPGIGSRFSFELTLPRADAALADPAPATPAGQLGGRRVLFAEDHPLSQEILFEMLEDLGCEVDVASDGIEAVQCASERDYDLILMDMQMPKMDGLAATRAIRQMARQRGTPIIALTANAFAEDRQRCFEAGMNDHLGKPVTPETLSAALGRWLPSMADRPVASTDGEDAFQIPGLHPPAALTGTPQRRAEYRALLQRFAELHGRDMVRIEEQLKDGRIEEARKLAHDLKGIAGLIGARRVAQLANDIVSTLRSPGGADNAAPLIAACATELGLVTTAAATLAEESSSSPAGAAVPVNR